MSNSFYLFVLKSTLAFTFVIVTHAVVNNLWFSVNNASVFCLYYTTQCVLSLTMLCFVYFSKHKSVYLYIGLTLIKMLLILGYIYPSVSDKNMSYLYHVLAIFTTFQFIEMALLSKTLKIS